MHVTNDPIALIGLRDPVVNHLHRQFDGLRPVQFPGPKAVLRLARAMAALYGTEDPADHEQIAKQWQPFRSWIALSTRQWLESETHEIATGITTHQVSVPQFAVRSSQFAVEHHLRK